MKTVLIASAFVLAAMPALAESELEAGNPLAPCLKDGSSPEIVQLDSAWGVEIASSFSEQEALEEFSRAQNDYSDILGDFSATVVAVCDLSMGTDLRYSARIAFEDREDADKLCSKLQAAGGACIVVKN